MSRVGLALLAAPALAARVQVHEHVHLSEENAESWWSTSGAECYSGRNFDGVVGRKALIITTSHAVLGDAGCADCDPAGVFAEEMTAPYYVFKDAGMEVTLASIQGGVVPINPEPCNSRLDSDQRFCHDPSAQEDAHNSPSITDVNFCDYDIIFMAGGWGAAWDLGASDELAAKLTRAYTNPDQFLGSVCHGALGFVRATKPDGSLLPEGLHMTGVSNRQIEALGIASITPMHPEEELKRAGAIYEVNHGVFSDLRQNLVVIEGNIVTGQNQEASCQAPQELMTKLQSHLAESRRGRRRSA